MLTFPPKTFGESAVALPVIFRGNGVAALAKPAGIAVDEHPWTGTRPTLCGELRRRIARGSASALALGLARPAAVALADAEISGVVLLADREGGVLEAWRNALGSGQFLFRFLLLSRISPAGTRTVAGTTGTRKRGEKCAGAAEEISCALPVAAHFSEPRALISRRTGKRAETRFLCVEKFGTFELWAAETAFPRLHQIRLHAAEVGLPIVGDPLYGGVPAIVNAAFGRKGRLNKGEERPIYAPLCLHLEKIRISPRAVAALPDGGEIFAPLPDGFSALLKKLRSRSFRGPAAWSVPARQKNSAFPS